MGVSVFGIGTRAGNAVATCVAAPGAAVERRLADIAASSFGPAGEVAGYLLDAGGKRIRPTLVLLSAGACGGDPGDSRVVDVAAASELVHMASLVHDDVVDETHKRRGLPTANDKWGNKLSVLVGDFLLARAFELLAGVADAQIIEVLSATAVRMAESEILQAECEGSLAGWRDNYWRIIQGKTSAFISACCECGAILASAGPDLRKSLAKFGSHFGTAFQITDDLLDISGSHSATGKDIGADLAHGKFTLPVLLALQHASGQQLERLMSLCEIGFLSQEEAREAADLVVTAGGDRMARQLAQRHVEEARDCLRHIAASDFTMALDRLVCSLSNRER